METRVKLLGHPIHPMLIVFPLALLSTAVIFDVAYVLTGNPELAVVSFWAIPVGLIGGVAAAVFGLIDWLALPRDTRARRIGFAHGGGNAIILVIFLLSWLPRLDGHAYLPNVLPLVLGLVGAAGALVTAWLGGELVYRLGVAIDRDAHLDAPSSLATSGAAEVTEASHR
jgi:uncharacterized membrane protein